MIDPVGSKARCGSAVFSVNELSTTSVGAAVPCTEAPSAAAANASAPIPASSRCHFDLRTSECLTLLLLSNGFGATPAADPIRDRARSQARGPRRRRRRWTAFGLKPAGGAPAFAELEERRLLGGATIEGV